eukprot:Nitzschia sp. Nitz4//scaffold11_size288233//198299//200606//NITZ4_000797-RA/size288233-snap-gene-0.29-mRNA-1//1//CDS//3329534143//5531//frame0
MNMMSGPVASSHPSGSLPAFVGTPPTTVGAVPPPSGPPGSAPMPSNLSTALANEQGIRPPANPSEYAQGPLPTSVPMPPPQSLPWTVGCTDGTFATMTLMQQQQQQQLNAQYANGQGQNPPGSGGAAIGATGEAAGSLEALAALQAGKSLFHDRLFHQSSGSVEAVLAASCDVMGFDIAEMWLRTGPKTHQLTNSHLRPTALEDSVRKEIVDVYYGERSSERTHRLSPALCKRAKDANDVVWVTAHTEFGAEALRCSISNVRTAVAIPVCHEVSNTNMTLIFFSMRRNIMRPTAVEFLVHMSLCAAVASVNNLAEDGLVDRPTSSKTGQPLLPQPGAAISRSDHTGQTQKEMVTPHQRLEHTSITGARLDLQWRQLHNVEYLTDGGNSWIHTAVFKGKPVVIKTLKPECQDTAVAINEIEGELDIHSRLNHPNIVSLIGAGLTSKGVRFVVLERLDGGTLTQMLGYDTRIRDRRRRFWHKKQLPYADVLRTARAMASAMQYCHEQAVPGGMILHRDLKPDNIGFTLDGTVKIMDFGLSRILDNADPSSDEVYAMSGETGSLRYMAPEVAEALPYNHKADVYSFAIIFWELNSGKKPFIGLNREQFYERVVHGGERPSLNKKWPPELCKLLSSCWDVDIENRPTFAQIGEQLEVLLEKEQQGGSMKSISRKISGMIDRHSTWF